MTCVFANIEDWELPQNCLVSSTLTYQHDDTISGIRYK